METSQCRSSLVFLRSSLTLFKDPDDLFFAEPAVLPGGNGDRAPGSMIAAVGNGSAFRKGREFAAWLGLTPWLAVKAGCPMRSQPLALLSLGLRPAAR